MDSQKIKFYSEQKHNCYLNDKQKLNRKSTKAMSEKQGNRNRLRVNKNPSQSVQPPSPVSSSDDVSSAQVKYLSYLAQVIDSAPEGSDVQEIQQHYQSAEYWHVVYQSAIYVRKDVYRTQIDDNLIISQISEYLIPGRIHPSYANEIGQQLLENGYFLSAYAIATARKRKSAFIFRYLMQHFNKQYHIETNHEEFMHIIQNYVHTDEVEDILHLNLDQPQSGSNRKQNLTPGNDFSLQNPASSQLTPNRMTYQQYLQQESQRSRTVIIGDDSELSVNRSSVAI